MNKIQAKIITKMYTSDKPQFTVAEVCVLVDCTYNYAMSNLNILLAAGKVEKVEGSRRSFYRLKQTADADYEEALSTLNPKKEAVEDVLRNADVDSSN